MFGRRFSTGTLVFRYVEKKKQTTEYCRSALIITLIITNENETIYRRCMTEKKDVRFSQQGIFYE